MGSRYISSKCNFKITPKHRSVTLLLWNVTLEEQSYVGTLHHFFENIFGWKRIKGNFKRVPILREITVSALNGWSQKDIYMHDRHSIIMYTRKEKKSYFKTVSFCRKVISFFYVYEKENEISLTSKGAYMLGDRRN